MYRYVQPSPLPHCTVIEIRSSPSSVKKGGKPLVKKKPPYFWSNITVPASMMLSVVFSMPPCQCSSLFPTKTNDGAN